MKDDSQTLDEVVVVGFGTQKKVNLTGAVASLDVKQQRVDLLPVLRRAWR